MAVSRRYVMTAKRKAALRKAQLASAKKRKGRGSKGRVRRANSRSVMANKRLSYATNKKYHSRGGAYALHSDRKHSRGIYATNRHGKPLSKGAKRANRYAANYMLTNPGYAAVVGASKYRGRKKKSTGYTPKKAKR